MKSLSIPLLLRNKYLKLFSVWSIDFSIATGYRTKKNIGYEKTLIEKKNPNLYRSSSHSILILVQCRYLKNKKNKISSCKNSKIFYLRYRQEKKRKKHFFVVVENSLTKMFSCCCCYCRIKCFFLFLNNLRKILGRRGV